MGPVVGLVVSAPHHHIHKLIDYMADVPSLRSLVTQTSQVRGARLLCILGPSVMKGEKQLTLLQLSTKRAPRLVSSELSGWPLRSRDAHVDSLNPCM